MWHGEVCGQQREQPRLTAPLHRRPRAAAIKSLKERSGSSSKAIAKYIGATYKVPTGFEKTLGQQLKRLAAAGKLVKVKASFKLSDELKKEPKVRVLAGAGRCCCR